MAPIEFFGTKNFGGWCSCCYSDSELIAKYRRIGIVSHIFDGTKYEGTQ